MAENEESGAAATAGAAEQEKPGMSILAQYVRDMSFENLAAQNGLPAGQKPDIKVAVNLDAKSRSDGSYESILKINATATSEAGALFVAELEYAGLFRIQGVPKEQVHPFLMVECPRFIFPFARRIVADMTRDGGYPPLLLDNVDFLTIYRQEVARRQAAAEGAATSSGDGANGADEGGGEGDGKLIT